MDICPKKAAHSFNSAHMCTWSQHGKEMWVGGGGRTRVSATHTHAKGRNGRGDRKWENSNL
eukprot:scaffold42942_cov45-Tisochrysis_lutea.AAC.1